MIRHSEYELVFIAHPGLDREEQVPALISRVQEIVEAVGGQVAHTDIWGRRRLAFPIRKQKEGTYVLLRVILPRQAIKELERVLKLSEDILRYLVVRAETPLPTRPPSGPPSPQQRRPEPELDEDEDLDDYDEDEGEDQDEDEDDE
jgi:small subunit ribosomal protein S6